MIPWFFLIGLLDSQPVTHVETLGHFRLGASVAAAFDFGERPLILGAAAAHLSEQLGPLRLSFDAIAPRGPESRDADVGLRGDALMPLGPVLVGAEYFGYDLEPGDVDGPGPHQYFGATGRWGGVRFTPSIESFAGKLAPSWQVWWAMPLW